MQETKANTTTSGCLVWVNMTESRPQIHITPVEDIQDTSSSILATDLLSQACLDGFFCTSAEGDNFWCVKATLGQGIDYGALVDRDGLDHPFLCQKFELSLVGSPEWIDSLRQVYCFYTPDSFDACSAKVPHYAAEMRRRMASAACP